MEQELIETLFQLHHSGDVRSPGNLSLVPGNPKGY